MLNQQPVSTVDVICDLRQFRKSIDDIGSVHEIWRELGAMLPGNPLLPGKPLIVQKPEGNLLLWVVDAHGLGRIQPDTSFRIVDLLRSPKLLYRCRVCGEYGPLRCTRCEQSGRETRLCSEHAHTIKHELRAYCNEHIPRCECRPGCREKAVFRCRRCHGLFGEHVQHPHPVDRNVDYCRDCYRILFEKCSIPGCRNLGRAKCAYQTRQMKEPCETPLCSEHSFQWKIWGPHNRGVTLCRQHKNLLGTTDPADLLFMMLTADAPFVRRGKRQSLPNPFRLRRIINRNRAVGLSFQQISRVIKSLEYQVPKWGSRAAKKYSYMDKTFHETTQKLPAIEANLFPRVKSFYQTTCGLEAARQITGLEITDCFYKPGQDPRYRVCLHLINTANKGVFIGRGGSVIKQLCRSLNIEIDLRN